MIKKKIKRVLLTLLIIIIILITAPFLFKNQIVQLVKDQANANLNAKVDFGNFDLSLIRSFPDFNFVIEKISVINKAPFEGDTLAYIEKLAIDVNFKSILSGGPYQINTLLIDKPVINGKILPNGVANWDLTPPQDTTIKAEVATTTPTPELKEATKENTKFSVKLKAFDIKNARIKYDDMKGGMSANLHDLTYHLEGDFTKDDFLLKTYLKIAETSVKSGAVNYLSKTNLNFNLELNMNMPNMKFVIKKNELQLNELSLGFEGMITILKDDINMDVKFTTNKADFKSILSLIPVVFTKEFATIKTTGKLLLNGYAKGTMHKSKDGKSDIFPSFGINLGIENAMFKYPTLPKAVDNINVKISVVNNKNFLDATQINVSTFHVNLAGNLIDAKVQVSTPISDPSITADLKGKLDLKTIKEFVPLDKDDAMSGGIKIDVAAAGNLSSLTKKEYDKFKLTGLFEINDIDYKSKTLAYDVFLKTLKLNFSTKFVELASFDAKIGKSDIKAQGKIDNFMQYLFKNSLIVGKFDVQSTLLDLNELTAKPAGTDTTKAKNKPITPANTTSNTAAADSAKIKGKVAEVPGSIDFVLNIKFNHVLFDKYDITNMNGNIVLRNRKLNMTNLNLNIIDGSVTMNGYYETTNPKKPSVGLTFKVENFDVQKTFNTFNTIQKIAAIGKYTQGLFSATIENFNADLDEAMSPVLNTMKGHGVLKTKNVSISGYAPFEKLADALKNPDLKKVVFENITADYEFKNGRIYLLNPIKTKVNTIDVEIIGSTGFDQTIDYTWKLDIPTDIAGSEASKAVSGLLNQANSALGLSSSINLPKTIKVDVGFGGTVTKPTIKTGFKSLGGASKNIVNSVKTEAVNMAKDKANEEAQKILADGQKQVAALKEEAQKLSDKMKEEGYAEIDKIAAQASDPFSKMAAKKIAEVAKKEVDKKAQAIINQAEIKSQKILEDAKTKSASMTKH